MESNVKLNLAKAIGAGLLSTILMLGGDAQAVPISSSATLVYKLQNGTNRSLTNIVVSGSVNPPLVNITASRGSYSSKVSNPRSNTRSITWSGFTLASGEQATLTVQLSSVPAKGSIASAWTASWKSNNKSASASVGAVVR